MNNKNKMINKLMSRRNKMTTKLNWRANNFGLKRDVLKLVCEVQNKMYEYSLKHLNDPFYTRVGKWHRLYHFNSHRISVIKTQDGRIMDKNCNMISYEQEHKGKMVYEMCLGNETWTFETWKEMKNFITSGEMDKEFWQRCEQEDDWNRDHDYDCEQRQDDHDDDQYYEDGIKELNKLYIEGKLDDDLLDQITKDDSQVTQDHVESDENIVTSTENDIGLNNTEVF